MSSPEDKAAGKLWNGALDAQHVFGDLDGRRPALLAVHGATDGGTAYGGTAYGGTAYGGTAYGGVVGPRRPAGPVRRPGPPAGSPAA
ncbi:hypothetical protein [Streptomyces sp. NPDC058295]|uniref:hypothetical protein n=1 Tax=Streptomyces sp. NPDC058295 TaxID=3346431 RepID=UPI0036E0F84B